MKDKKTKKELKNLKDLQFEFRKAILNCDLDYLKDILSENKNRYEFNLDKFAIYHKETLNKSYVSLKDTITGQIQLNRADIVKVLLEEWADIYYKQPYYFASYLARGGIENIDDFAKHCFKEALKAGNIEIAALIAEHFELDEKTIKKLKGGDAYYPFLAKIIEKYINSNDLDEINKALDDISNISLGVGVSNRIKEDMKNVFTAYMGGDEFDLTAIDYALMMSAHHKIDGVQYKDATDSTNVSSDDLTKFMDKSHLLLKWLLRLGCETVITDASIDNQGSLEVTVKFSHTELRDYEDKITLSKEDEILLINSSILKGKKDSLTEEQKSIRETIAKFIVGTIVSNSNSLDAYQSIYYDAQSAIISGVGSLKNIAAKTTLENGVKYEQPGEITIELKEYVATYEGVRNIFKEEDFKGFAKEVREEIKVKNELNATSVEPVNDVEKNWANLT